MQTLKLTKPIEALGEEVRELTFPDEATAEDLLASDKAEGEIGKQLVIMSRLTGIPQSSLKKMNGRDFRKAIVITQGFFSDGPPTGGADS